MDDSAFPPPSMHSLVQAGAAEDCQQKRIRALVELPIVFMGGLLQQLSCWQGSIHTPGWVEDVNVLPKKSCNERDENQSSRLPNRRKRLARGSKRAKVPSENAQLLKAAPTLVCLSSCLLQQDQSRMHKASKSGGTRLRCGWIRHASVTASKPPSTPVGCPQPPSSLHPTTPTSSALDSEPVPHAPHEVEDGTIPSTGPAFIGKVFTMCDSSHRALVATTGGVPKPLPLLPALPPWLLDTVDNVVRATRSLTARRGPEEKPLFHFFFEGSDAEAYVARAKRRGKDSEEMQKSTVGSLPLASAYSYSKVEPSKFEFVPAAKQVKEAKSMLSQQKGKAAAQHFRGVPVFTARNLTIAMSTSSGIRWFTPYFFDKRQLADLVGQSVENHYSSLIAARRQVRHSGMGGGVEGGGLPGLGGAGGGASGDEEDDGLMDPGEMREFMEDVGAGGGAPVEHLFLRSLQNMVMDTADQVLLSNRWGRRLCGLQPQFPVTVESFEQRVAAAEAAAIAQARLREARKAEATTFDLSDEPAKRPPPSHGSSGSSSPGPSTNEEHSSQGGQRSGDGPSGNEEGKQKRMQAEQTGSLWGVPRTQPSVKPGSSDGLQREGEVGQGARMLKDVGGLGALSDEEPVLALVAVQGKPLPFSESVKEGSTDEVIERAYKELEASKLARSGVVEDGPLFIASLGDQSDDMMVVM